MTKDKSGSEICFPGLNGASTFCFTQDVLDISSENDPEELEKPKELGNFLTEKESYHLLTADLDLVSKSCLVASCSKVVSTSLSGKWM